MSRDVVTPHAGSSPCYLPTSTPLCLVLCRYSEAPFGTPWTGGVAAWLWGPEHLVRRAGFFVHRPPPPLSTYSSAARLEVMRVGPIKQRGFDETGQMWFYHAVGSGIFVRTLHFTRVDAHYERHMSVPRIEIVASLGDPHTSAPTPTSRAAAFWPVRVPFERRDGSACHSTSAQYLILSCAGLPVPIWPGDNDPLPQNPQPRPCGPHLTADWLSTCVEEPPPPPLPSPPPPLPSPPPPLPSPLTLPSPPPSPSASHTPSAATRAPLPAGAPLPYATPHSTVSSSPPRSSAISPPLTPDPPFHDPYEAPHALLSSATTTDAAGPTTSSSMPTSQATAIVTGMMVRGAWDSNAPPSPTGLPYMGLERSSLADRASI